MQGFVDLHSKNSHCDRANKRNDSRELAKDETSSLLKTFIMKKQKLSPEEKQDLKKDKRIFNDLVKRARRKDALIEINILNHK